MTNIEGLACLGIGVIATIVYAVVIAVCSIFYYEDNGWYAVVVGGILFVTVVLLWATTSCPFFVGVG